MGKWREVSSDSSGEEEQEDFCFLSMSAFATVLCPSLCSHFWSLQDPAFDLSVEQLSYIKCGKLFADAAGFLPVKSFEDNAIWCNIHVLLPCCQSLRGLSEFFENWRGSFRYMSDCNLVGKKWQKYKNQHNQLQPCHTWGSGVDAPLYALQMLLDGAFPIEYLYLGFFIWC